MSSAASEVVRRPTTRRPPGSDDRNRSELFPGPVPFTEKQRALFFGREREVFDLMAVIHAQRVLLVHGASGTGKTSLLQAGVAPEARKAGFDVLPSARVRVVEERGHAGAVPPAPRGSGNYYVDNLLRYWQVSGFDAPEAEDVSLAGFLAARRDPNREHQGRILILDQFEELFTAHPERWPDRAGFFSQVQAALDADDGLRVVFLIRDDYLAHIEHYAPQLRDRLSTRYHLRGLREADALKAVVGPFGKAEPSQKFAPGVAETLVKNLFQVPSTQREFPGYHEEFVEPVHLQIVCLALAERVVGVREITDVHLKAYADVKKVLADFYDQAVEAALKGQRRVSERRLRLWVEQKLIISGRTRAPLYQDPEKDTTAGMDNKVVAALEQSRLLQAELRGGEARWVELTHDRFIEPVVKSNRDWFAKRSRRWAWWAPALGFGASLFLGFALGWFSSEETVSAEMQTCDRVEQLRSDAPGSDCPFFDAKAGQVITAALSTPESREQGIELLGPGDNVVASARSRAPILVFRVKEPGEYILRAAAGPAGGSYRLRATMHAVEVKRAQLTADSSVEGSIKQPDTANGYTFQGRKGAVALLEMVGRRMGSRLTLVAPTGQAFVEDGRLTDQSRAGAHLLATLPEDGTYQVWVSSAGTKGSYTLNLAFPTTRPLTAGVTFGELDDPRSIALYTLTAPPGLPPGTVAIVTAAPRLDLDVRLRLLAPDSFLLADRNERQQGGEVESFVHPVAQGVTYLVAVSSPADFSIGFYQLSVAYQRPVPLTDKATATIRTRGQVDVFDFRGAPGEVATVVVTPSGTLDSLVDVYAPDGTTLLFKDETVSGQEELFAVRLPAEGTYVVSVSGYSGSGAVGTYELALTRSSGSR